MSVLKQIFSDSRSKAIEDLWKSEDKKLLLKQVSSEIEDCSQPIWVYPKEQVIAIAMQAHFASMDESFYVGNILNSLLAQPKDILPEITKHRGLDFAGRCLVSTGFFWNYMENRTKRYGAPSPKFYTREGIRQFNSLGLEEIAEHFQSWQVFLADEYSIAG